MKKTEQAPLSPWREYLHQVIFEANTLAGILFDIGLLIAILLSVVLISLETVAPVMAVKSRSETIFWLHWFFTGLFTVEYLLRIICVRRPLRYIFSFWGIIDLMAFLPEYLLLGVPGIEVGSFSVLRTLRLLRVFRIFRLNWIQHEAEDLGGAVFRSRGKILVFVTVVMILVTVAGTMIYEVENAFADKPGTPNGKFSQVHSIPGGIYWAIVTMTTVGFGDIVPVTIAGKFLSAFLILIGYSLIIVPTGFVSAEFAQSRRKQVTTVSCPSCITEGHDNDAVYCKYCGEKL